MGQEYLRTIHGMISLLQIAIGAAALFTCSFIWSNSNVYFQFYWGEYPGQIYVFFALFVTWIIVSGLLVMEVMGRDLLEGLGKMKLTTPLILVQQITPQTLVVTNVSIDEFKSEKLILIHVFCLGMVIIAGAVDSYYLNSHTWSSSYYKRLITVTVFLWILVVSYIVQILYVVFQ